MPSSQSTILQHFSPRRAGEWSMGRWNGAARDSQRDSTDSEGSAGVAAIPLSSNRGSPVPSRPASTQRRSTKRPIVESDESESDVQIIEAPRTRNKAKGKSTAPPPAALEETSTRAERKSRRMPSPLNLAKATNRPASFVIELPGLSAEQKSLYSATPTPSASSAHLLRTVKSRSKQREAKSPSAKSLPKTKQSKSRLETASLNHHQKAQGKAAKRTPAESSDEDLTRSARRYLPSDSESEERGRSAKRKPNVSRSKPKARQKRTDPDDSGDAETEDEDLAKELEMDEPERFKSQTRLRKKKETTVQRNIRKLKERRDGIFNSSTEEESEEKQTWAYETVSDSEEDFIVDDGGRVEEGLLPHQFSNNSAQTPEFKFKVVFHYLVLLVLKGPKLLPLKGDLAEYFKPQLRDLRRKMEGYRDGRVRSQIWRPRFVEALQTFPALRTVHLEMAELGCDACNVATKRSTFRSYLEGGKYDKETHEIDDSGSDSGSESSSEEDLPREFLMGKHCKRRSEVFHAMSHWENQLFQRIRGYYNDLLRAKNKPVPEDSEASSSDQSNDSDADDRKADRAIRRQITAERVAKLKRGNLPFDAYNENQVLEWMDARGYQAADYRRLEDLMEQSRMLEHDKSKDD